MLKKSGFKPCRVSPKQFGLLPCSDICDNALRWVSRGAYKFRNMLICKNLHQTVNSFSLFWEKSQKTWWLPISMTPSFPINFYDKIKKMILVVTGLVPPKKGRPPKELGIQILSSFFFVQKALAPVKKWPAGFFEWALIWSSLPSAVRFKWSPNFRGVFSIQYIEGTYSASI